MPVQQTLIPGAFIDCDLSATGLLYCTLQDNRAAIWLPNGQVRHTPEHERRLIQGRFACNPAGQYSVIAKDNTDHAWLSLRGHQWVDIGTVFGDESVLVWWDGHHFAWGRVTDGGGMFAWETEIDAQKKTQIKTTSQGVIQMIGGQPVLFDAMRGYKVGGVPTLKAYRYGDWTVAAAANPDRLIVQRGSTVFEPYEGPIYAPRLRVSGGVVYIVTSTGRGQSYLLTVREPYPARPTTPTPTPEPPTPEPPTPDTTEEPPVPEIPNYKAVVEKWRAFYDHVPPSRARGEFITNAVAYELRAEGAGGFYKPGEPNDRSIDVIIFKPRGETFDILGDAEGKATPQWGRTRPTGFGDLAKWREPRAISTEPTTPTPDPPTQPPTQPPTTGCQCDKVLATLDAIRVQQERLEQMFRALLETQADHDAALGRIERAATAARKGQADMGFIGNRPISLDAL